MITIDVDKWNKVGIEHNSKINNKHCVITIPVYKEKLSYFEQESLKQCVKILGNEFEILLFGPETLNYNVYNTICDGYQFSIMRCPNEYFKSQRTYSDLCETWCFYNTLREYEFLLIYQLDAWIFANQLNDFIKMGYDYIGGVHKVGWSGNKYGENGNGGFSLRKISKFIDVCKKNNFERYYLLEDCVFTGTLKKYFHLAPIDVCRRFSWQERPEIVMKQNNGKLPMGCHNPIRCNPMFWKNYIPALVTNANQNIHALQQIEILDEVWHVNREQLRRKVNKTIKSRKIVKIH